MFEQLNTSIARYIESRPLAVIPAKMKATTEALCVTAPMRTPNSPAITGWCVARANS